jgi:hypothetical protein
VEEKKKKRKLVEHRTSQMKDERFMCKLSYELSSRIRSLKGLCHSKIRLDLGNALRIRFLIPISTLEDESHLCEGTMCPDAWGPCIHSFMNVL